MALTVAVSWSSFFLAMSKSCMSSCAIYLLEVSDSLNGVELTGLRRKELMHESAVVGFLLDYLAVMDREVVHHHDSLMQKDFILDF
jgi:hypothetical protein